MFDGRKAVVQLHIIIVGAGIGGLSAAYCLAQAGHRITVVERTKELKEIGAGIQLTPNSSRLLMRWGLGGKLEEIAGSDRCEATSIFRYTGNLLVRQHQDEASEHHCDGAPTYQMHRADLQKMLYELASPHMTLRLGTEVASTDPSAPSVTLKSGEILSGDLVVGADGIHSIVRKVLGNPQEPEPTHDSTYRYLIPADEMLANPELQPFIETPSLASWLGPEKHVVGYGRRGKSLYNMAVYVPEPEFQIPGVYTTKGDPNHMRAAYDKEGENWDPRVRKLLSLARSDHVLKFKMLHCKPLDTWVHPAGRVTLLGDACHSFPPHYGQGSALAVEDAAVLGNLFSRLTDHSQIKSLLQAYEAIRRPRASATWLDTMERQVWLHYRDGSNQEARDAGIKDIKILKHRREHEAMIPIQCTDPYGYDADEVVDIWWRQNGGEPVVE